MTDLQNFINKVMLFAGSARDKFNEITAKIGTLSGLNTTAKNDVVSAINEVHNKFGDYIPNSKKGAANGVAETDSNNKILVQHLPSYVDDVIEGTFVSTTVFDDTSGSPITLESGKIYVDVDTNKTYRYTGTILVVISESIVLGETASTAYRGDRGKIAYDHSLATSGNPHNVTKSDVGLGSVQNYGIASKIEAEAGVLNTKYSTPLRVAEQVNKMVGTSDPNTEFITGLN